MIKQLRAVEGARLWANAPLAPFTTIGTGGKAALLITVATTEGLAEVLTALAESGAPWICLGAGSNLLVADQGYSGVVIKLGEGFHYVEGLPTAADRRTRTGKTSLTAGAGAYLARLATVVAESGLSGLEFGCGIPGSLGGGVVMNAGAHGRCLADVAEAVELTSAAGARWVPGHALEWAYRSCTLPGGSVVTAVRFELAAGDPAAILEYQRSLLRARRISQPRGVRTFGSVFKNPPGNTAGRLLEEAGLKGVHRGGAEVSSVHANFLVNLGDATTADVLALMSLMRQAVYRASGVLLEPEVKLLGANFPWDSWSESPQEPAPRNG